MRSIESLLLLVDLLAYLALAIPLPLALRWFCHLAAMALPMAIAQVLLEGPRWQMIPAYGLAGLLFLLWLHWNRTSAGKPSSRKWLNRLAIGLGGLGLAVSIALPIILPVFCFPHPGGPYSIGTLTCHWVDGGRQEVFTRDPNDHRELMVQIWYPAKADPSAPRAPYLADAVALSKAFARVVDKPEWLFGNLRHIASIAIPSVSVAEDQPHYPVLIFLEGLTGFRQMNTFQVEELVSQGYIVVAIDQPYAAVQVNFPNGHWAAMPPLAQVRPLVVQSYRPAERAPLLNGKAFKDGIIPYLAQDVVFALNQLTALNQTTNGILAGRLDLARVGTFGVSLGGIVGSEACRIEPRLRACLVMDAPMPTQVVRSGLRQPTMWITRDVETMRLERQQAGGWPEVEILAHQTTMRAVFEKLPGEGYIVRVAGLFHVNLTDIPLWSPLWSWLGVTGPIGGQRAHRIINDYSRAFFDRHLKDRPAALLNGPAAHYPEVLLETRRH